MSTASHQFSFDDDHTTRAWLATVWFMFAALIATAPAYALDTRTLWDVSVWSKPLKFDLSMMVHFATLAILAQQLARPKRTGIIMTGVVWASIGGALFEIVYMTIQAARGRQSHFNFDTEFESLMYALMGLGALLLILAPFVLGAYLAFQRDGNKSGFRFGAVIGLLISPILTLTVAGYMSMSGSHWVGDGVSDANGVPFFGWSLTVGDLRPSHFVALHAMQALPILGLLVDKVMPPLARPAVIAGAVVTIALTIWLFMQALGGNPLY